MRGHSLCLAQRFSHSVQTQTQCVFRLSLCRTRRSVQVHRNRECNSLIISQESYIKTYPNPRSTGAGIRKYRVYIVFRV